jgi:hypothetical protein
VPVTAGIVACLALWAGSAPADPASAARAARFSFTVAGSSSDCGDVVMPAIAAAARRTQTRFHWHLGESRNGTTPDRDFLMERRYQTTATAPNRGDYQHLAIADAIEHQFRPFGDLPLYIGIGGRDDVRPMSRLEYRVALKERLDRPELAAQRAADGEDAVSQTPLPPTYFHWRYGGVEFINLDNATNYGFDPAQLRWFDAVLARAVADPSVRTLVVGMYAALPHGVAAARSMCASAAGVRSGLQVYRALVAARAAGKEVHVLAAHAHSYLAQVYDTDYWRAPGHGGVVLPGYIVGTAGAQREALPADTALDETSIAGSYGYLRGTVDGAGHVEFRFEPLNAGDLERARSPDFEDAVGGYCSGDLPDVLKAWPAASCDDPVER